MDYMHCVCLGVIQQLVNLSMDSKQNDKSYYIGRREAEINDRLLAINTPSEITPRSFTYRTYWKASEWRAFIFYSLIVLHGILPQVFFTHLFLFLYGVYYLLSDSIDEMLHIQCASVGAFCSVSERLWSSLVIFCLCL